MLTKNGSEMNFKNLKFFYSFCILFIFCSCSAAQTSASRHPDKTPKTSKHRLWEYKTGHFNMYSWEQDVRLGEQVMKQQLKVFRKKNVAVNPPEFKKTLERANHIVKKLVAHSDIPSLPYQIYIFDKPDVVNAFCLPGGQIGIFTGLFAAEKGLVKLGDDDELAAVLAHEIAHATLRHVTRRLTTANGLGFVGNFVSLGVGKSVGSEWQFAFDQVFQTGTALYFPSYSRKHEREADQVGFYYMVKAGFDPQAAIRLWDRAAEKNAQKGSHKTSFFASHPASGERANTLRGFLPDIK